MPLIVLFSGGIAGAGLLHSESFIANALKFVSEAQTWAHTAGSAVSLP